MLRLTYRCVLHLHPPAFRKRFADEMLSIFEDTAKTSDALKLLADGVVSLVRQWTMRSEFWHEISPTHQPAPDGIPSFYSLDPFRPRAGAVIHGLVLSTAVFCLTCFAIRYSWIHALRVRIPEVQSDSQPPIERNADVARGASPQKTAAPPSSVSKVPAGSSTVPISSAHVPARIQPDQRASQSGTLPTQMPRPAPGPPAWSQVSSGAVRTAGTDTTPKPALVPQSAIANDLAAQAVPLLDHTSVGPLHGQPSNVQSGTAVRSAPLAEGLQLTATDRQRIIRGAIAMLAKYYIDQNAAPKMTTALLAHDNNGDDDAATDGEVFAGLLTRQMTEASHDKHVAMVYSAVSSPAPTSQDVALYRKEMEGNNCSIEAVRILPHNIGYLKFNQFPDASVCKARVVAAINSLNHADAIIFDLRNNRGGYANMVALIATYLFDHPTHLNDFYNRGDNTTEQSWTLPPVPGNRLADKPVLVLTSHTTFSAAEAFSYDLKMLNRATLVGETTSGRGRMGMPHRIDDHFTILIPGIRAINPISNTNWEGTGVEPDVKVKAADALKTAQELARKKLQQN